LARTSIGERGKAWYLNHGRNLNGPYDVETVRGSALADAPDDNAIAAAEEVAGFENRLASIDARQGISDLMRRATRQKRNMVNHFRNIRRTGKTKENLKYCHRSISYRRAGAR
jgi:hypothetical protein